MQLAAPALCLVTDRNRCGGRRIEDVVEAAVDGGVSMVQLREKDLSASDLYSLALRLKAAIEERALLFVNDRVDVALAVEADGVQLGENSMSVDAVRRICGKRLLIGRSVHSVEGAIKAEAGGADLLVLGTIFPTASHIGARTGGVELVREVSADVEVPFLGIGGIDAQNVDRVIAAGATGAAVITAITMAPSPGEASADLLTAMQSAFARPSSRAN